MSTTHQGPRRSFGDLSRAGAKVGAVLAVLVLALGLAFPWRHVVVDRYHQIVNSASDRLHGQPQQYADSTLDVASSSIADHAPKLVTDGDPATYWAADVGRNSNIVQQWVQVSFRAPVNLSALIITPVKQGAPGGFPAEPAPRRVHIQFGGTTRSELFSKDAELSAGKPATVSFDQVSQVAVVKLTIEGVYPPQSGTDSACAIAEVEFFGKQ